MNKDRKVHDKGPEVELTIDTPVVADVRELEIDVTLRNAGAAPLRVNILHFDYGPVVLRLRDAGGKTIPMMPPSVPPLDDGETGRALLAPGEMKHFYYYAGRLLDAPLPRGRYAVCFKVLLTAGPGGCDWAGELASSWVPFEVIGGLKSI
jgi:hypothetical protein